MRTMREGQNKKRLAEIKLTLERLDEKYYVKDEMDKEKYDHFCIKLYQIQILNSPI